MMTADNDSERLTALAVVTPPRSPLKRREGSSGGLARQLSRQASALDALNSYVDDSVGSTPIPTLARNKCHVPDALLLQGDDFETQMESNICRDALYVSQVKRIRSIVPTHTSERRKRLQQVCHALKRNDGAMTKCRLCSEFVDDAFVKMLCNALPNNTKLLALQLHNNRITDDGVLLLSRALKRHPNFNTLWIGGNRVSDQGVYYLCDLLKKNPRITDLNVSNRWPELRWEQTEHNDHPHISDHGAILLAELFRSCAESHASGGLKNLSLAQQRIADNGAIELFKSIPYTNLRTLNLKDNHLTDDCCEALNGLLSTQMNCKLEVLVLSKNHITNKGLFVILPGIEANASLHALDLSNNFIDIDGMRALKDSLFENRGLQAINLTGNTSEDDHGCEEFLKARVHMQVTNDIGNSADFFKQYKSFDIKKLNDNPPDVAKLILDDLMSDMGVHGNPLPSRSVRLDSPSPLNPFGSVSCLHSKDEVEENRKALETRQSEIVERSRSRGGMASRLGMAPRTPKPQTPDPVPAHKFLKRLSTRDMSATFRSFERGDSLQAVEREEDGDSSDGSDFFNEMSMESRDLFDSAGISYQYHNSGDSDSLPNQESLMDKDGLPLIPSPDKKKKDKGASLKLSETIDQYIIPCRNDIKPVRDIGKTIGVPYTGVVVGTKPVRTSVSRHGDSGQHVQYTKILTAADPPGTEPYSWVRIGADRQKEINRVKEERQTPQYKIQKRNAQIYNKVHGMRAAMKHLPPRRFWDEWKVTVDLKYPEGIDRAPGVVSIPFLEKKEDDSLKNENKLLARRREMAMQYGFIETKEYAMKKQKEVYAANKKAAAELEEQAKQRLHEDKKARMERRQKEMKQNANFHKHAAVGGNAAASAISGSGASVNINTLIGCKGGQSIGDKMSDDRGRRAAAGRRGLSFNLG